MTDSSVAKINIDRYLQDLEYVKCNLCGADDTTEIHDKERFGLALKTVICNQCGLVYLNPRPTPQSYAVLYESDYRKIMPVGTDQWLEQEFNRQYRYAANHLLPFFSKHYRGQLHSLLDVGCAYGGLVMPFKNAYPEVQLYGIEPVVENAKEAKKRTGADVRVGLFEDTLFDREFDLIIISRTLNHLLDPMSALHMARAQLAPEGHLLIVLHDAVDALLLQGKDKFTEITHPYIFTPETAKCMVSLAGFEIFGFASADIDITKLTERDVRSYSYHRILQKMLILARVDQSESCELPDANLIRDRINKYGAFYEEHAEIMSTGLLSERLKAVYFASAVKLKYLITSIVRAKQ